MPEHPKQSNGGGSGGNTGAPESFEEFYARHRGPFIKRLSRYMSAQDAEDLAQEVFMAVWQAQKLGEVREPHALAMRILKHARVDLWRKERARRKHLDQYARDYELLRAAPEATESAALQAERIRLLLQLRKVHPDAFRAFILRKYGELDYLQIAAAMGIGRNKASKLVRIAMLTVSSAEMQESNACVL